ncbi:MAG: hypothetical protein ABJB34_12485, partial [Acidobacteriota bacterium]
MKKESSTRSRRRLIILAIFVLASATDIFAAWKAPGNVTRVVKTKANAIVLETTSRAKISIEFFDLNVIRIRMAANGMFERDFSYGIDYSRDRMTPVTKLAQTPREITLSNFAGAKVVVARSPLSIRIFDEQGSEVLRDDASQPVLFDPETGEIQARKLRNSEVETYYGFGEKAFPEMSRDGKFIVNWNTDTFSYPVGT